jgi:hypothetical protein
MVQMAPARLEVLVIGGALPSANLAVELRMLGVRACVVGSEEELFSLMRSAWIRPLVAIVDLCVGEVGRDAEVRDRAILAALAGIPVLLIGAERGDIHVFGDIIRTVPPGTPPDQIVEAIAAWTKEPPPASDEREDTAPLDVEGNQVLLS